MNLNNMPQKSAEADQKLRRNIRKKNSKDFRDYEEMKGISGNYMVIVAIIAALALLASYVAYRDVEAKSAADPGPVKQGEAIDEEDFVIDPMERSYASMNEETRKAYDTYKLLLYVGNFMLPLAIFLMVRRSVDGDKSKSLRDVAMCGLAAILAEYPHDLLRYDIKGTYTAVQNPFVLLFICAIVVYSWAYCEEKKKSKRFVAFYQLLIMLAGLAVADLSRAENALFAVGLTIIYLYFYEYAVTQIFATVILGIYQISTPLTAIIIAFYDKRLPKEKLWRAFPAVYLAAIWGAALFLRK